jgi:hypothetical protein
MRREVGSRYARPHEEDTMAQERSLLLTEEQLDKLGALATALRSIAGINQPHLRDPLSDEIDRLRVLVADGGPREAIRELAEKLNAGTVLMDWADAIHDGEQVIDELALKLADESTEDDDGDV